MTRNVIRRAILEKGKDKGDHGKTGREKPDPKGKGKRQGQQRKGQKEKEKTKARRTRECEQWEKGAWIKRSLRVSA